VLIVLSLLAVGIALVLAGFLLNGLPSLRARTALRRGDIEAACRIYKSLLKENPEKLKYYRILGELYARQGRTDEQAIRVYELLLHLNLRFQRQREVLGWVAEHYLREGRKDTEALEIIEAAVQARLRELRQTGSDNSG